MKQCSNKIFIDLRITNFLKSMHSLHNVNYNPNEEYVIALQAKTLWSNIALPTLAPLQAHSNEGYVTMHEEETHHRYPSIMKLPGDPPP